MWDWEAKLKEGSGKMSFHPHLKSKKNAWERNETESTFSQSLPFSVETRSTQKKRNRKWISQPIYRLPDLHLFSAANPSSLIMTQWLQQTACWHNKSKAVEEVSKVTSNLSVGNHEDVNIFRLYIHCTLPHLVHCIPWQFQEYVVYDKEGWFPMKPEDHKASLPYLNSW